LAESTESIEVLLAGWSGPAGKQRQHVAGSRAEQVGQKFGERPPVAFGGAAHAGGDLVDVQGAVAGGDLAHDDRGPDLLLAEVVRRREARHVEEGEELASVTTLRSWIYKLRRERKASVSLLPVRVIASTAPTAREAVDGDTEIELKSGIRIRLSPNADLDYVAALAQRLG
jgi:hypothetical protein